MNTENKLDAQILALSLLQREYEKIRERNPAFSLRAYARKLGVHPSALSLVLRGKLPITLKTARKMASHLALEPEESQTILNQLRNRTERQLVKISGVRTLRESRRLEKDEFSCISEGIHFAILSLMETTRFQSCTNAVEFITKELQVTRKSAEQALERLLRLKLIEATPSTDSRQYRLTGTQYETTTDIADESIRKHHLEKLEIAKERLLDTPVELREFTGMTLAIDRKKLGEAKRMIQEFRKKLGQFLEEGEKQEVYLLNIQLMPFACPTSIDQQEKASHAS